MYSYPFFSFPHFGKYAPYYSTPSTIMKQPIRAKSYRPHASYAEPTNMKSQASCTNISSGTSKNSVKEKSLPKKAPTGFSFLNNFLHQEDRSDDEEFFNLFGLKLYHDDILLIGLIFFLYQEDVKDQYLFLALILLLLS